MSLTRELFKQQCDKFIEYCRNFGESWELQKGRDGQICRTTTESMSSDPLMLTKKEFRLDEETTEVLTHEYNIIYSDSFEVPVMYFTISKQDGSPLGYEKTLSSLIGFAADELKQVVHQVEHPILFRPFFMIHPCRTKLFMKSHKQLNPNYYLICWLSTVGSILGLRLDGRFADLTSH